MAFKASQVKKYDNFYRRSNFLIDLFFFLKMKIKWGCNNNFFFIIEQKIKKRKNSFLFSYRQWLCIQYSFGSWNWNMRGWEVKQFRLKSSMDKMTFFKVIFFKGHVLQLFGHEFLTSIIFFKKIFILFLYWDLQLIRLINFAVSFLFSFSQKKMLVIFF